MFSGIITDITEVAGQESSPDGLQLTFRRPVLWKDLELGESVSTEGVCLTVDAIDGGSYSATLIPQTLQATSFAQLVPKRVNIERSLKVGDRLSGHIVQGHIDDVGKILDIDQKDGHKLWIGFPPDKRSLIVAKGSVVVNGVALTVADLESERFRVALVPFTLDNTTLGTLRVGDAVNLEYDVLGKYITNLVDQRDKI